MSASASLAVIPSSTTSAAVPAGVVAAPSSIPAGLSGFSSIVIPSTRGSSSSNAAVASSSLAVTSLAVSSVASSPGALSSASSSPVAAVAAAAVSAIPSSAAGGSTASASSSSMSAGTIGGIIGGIVGGLALLGFAVFLWKKWRSRAERERYPLPPPRSLMSQRPSSVAGSAMLGHDPRRMLFGNPLMASSMSRQSFGPNSSSGFASRRESTYSTLAPPRPYYSGPSASASGSQSLGSTPDNSEAASRTSIDNSASSSAGPSAGQSPELSVADGWLVAPDVGLPGLPPVASSADNTGRSSPSASSSAGHGFEHGSSSSRSSSSAAAATAAGLPAPSMPVSPAGGSSRHQLRISTSSLGPLHQQYRREPSTARYSISSLSSARSFGQSGSLPSAGGSGGAKISGTPHGGRRVELTMPTPLGPADEWGMPDSRHYSTGGRYPYRGSTTSAAGDGPSARSDEHGRLH